MQKTIGVVSAVHTLMTRLSPKNGTVVAELLLVSRLVLSCPATSCRRAHASTAAAVTRGLAFSCTIVLDSYGVKVCERPYMRASYSTTRDQPGLRSAHRVDPLGRPDTVRSGGAHAPQTSMK